MLGEGKDSIEAINQEISELEKAIECYKNALQKTYQLLEKADRKLREDKVHYEHWLNVIENLEKSLIEVRGILQGKEARLLELKRKYYELISINKQDVDQVELSEEEKKILEGVELIDINYAHELLGMPSERLGELTLSEVSQIVGSMKIQEDDTFLQHLEEKGGKIETKSDFTETIRTLLLSGLRKIWNNRTNELSDEERKIILKAFHSLDKKRKRTPQEERLHRVMSAMVRAAFHNY